MSDLRDRIRQRVMERVCPACAFRGAGGACYTPDPQGCAILRNLERVIQIVGQVRSPRMGPYVERLREVVCARCENQDSGGHCRLRDHADCALEDYFGLIVEIVEEELAAVRKTTA